MSTTQRQNAAKLRREKAKAQSASPKKHIPVSAEGLVALQAEYDQLTKVKRKEISDALRRARGFGDLSENFEYHAARRDQGILNGQIADIELQLELAKIVPLRSLAAMQEALPFIRARFESYSAYNHASVSEVLGQAFAACSKRTAWRSSVKRSRIRRCSSRCCPSRPRSTTAARSSRTT